MTNDQPKPDIRQLGDRDLPETKFPAAADRFRVYLDPGVHAEIQKHAKRDLRVEIGGILVGHWEKDDAGPFVAVRNVICSELAASGEGELTFTHDAWADIHRVMDAEYADSSIVGWYHTHPDFGIFLSERDQFIHQHFFGDPGQIAYVVDPIRRQEGVFVWRGGSTAPCKHYWVGDQIHTAPEKNERRPDPAATSSGNEPADSATQPEPWRGDWLLISLLGVLFFLIGYLLADRKSTWEQARIVDGVVAHFGTMKVLRPGLKQNLGIVRRELKRLTGDLAKIRPADAEGKAALTQPELDQWKQRLTQIEDALEQIEAVYGLDELETAALAKLLGDEFARLRGGLDQDTPPTAATANNTAEQKPPHLQPESPPTPEPASDTAPPKQKDQESE